MSQTGPRRASVEPSHFPKLDGRVDLVAFDMDGTLLTDEFVLSPATKKAVARLLDRKTDVVLISGRMVATLAPFHRELLLTTPMICYNGALIWDVRESRALEHTPIVPDVAREIVEFAREQGLHLQYFWDDKFWAVERNPWLELYESRTRLKGHVVDDLRVFGPDRPPTKMQFIAEPRRVQELVAELRVRYEGRLYVTNTLPEYVEMMNPAISKGRGLQRLGKILGIAPERMLVFGDAQNDETMFRVAGHSVAMENARDTVKFAADLVTRSNREDGVAYALEALGLLD